MPFFQFQKIDWIPIFELKKLDQMPFCQFQEMDRTPFFEKLLVFPCFTPFSAFQIFPRWVINDVD